MGDPARRAICCDWWRGELHALYEGRARHPVMVALAETVAEFAIPIGPFEDLISAFEQDQVIRDYETYAQLLDYCTRSANPVGRLVLYLSRSYDDENARLSDCDLHRAPTGQLLAGRVPRPRDRPGLPAS